MLEALGAQADPRRSNLASGAAAAVMIFQLAVAPVTLGLAAAFVLIARVSRWRPLWLIVPAVAGLGWAAGAGAGRAVAGYLLVGSRLIQTLTEPAPLPAHLARLALLASYWRHGLPVQLPIALIVAAAQARLTVRLAAGERFRPGVIVAARRACVRAARRRGQFATPDGCCVGLIPDTGRRAAVSWEEARGGVLITGRDLAPVTSTGLELAVAAIQHRKTVIIADLAASAAGGSRPCQALAASVSAACTRMRAPLAILDADRGHYDPFERAGPEGAARLVSAMIDWTGTGPDQRRGCERVLREAFQVVAAGLPPPGGPHGATLDEVLRLLRPAGVFTATTAAAALAGQLGELRSTTLGARLSRPGPAAGDAIDLERAVARRECVLFCLDRDAHGLPGAMVARLVLADLVRVLADRAALRAPGDSLVFVNGCEPGDLEHVAALLATGPAAGSAIVVCAGDGAVARQLSGMVNVVAVRGQPPHDSAAHATSAVTAATAAGEILFSQCESREMPATALRPQRSDDLILRVRGPRPRVIAGCRAVR
jgi:hypothetical protein